MAAYCKWELSKSIESRIPAEKPYNSDKSENPTSGNDTGRGFTSVYLQNVQQNLHGVRLLLFTKSIRPV